MKPLIIIRHAEAVHHVQDLTGGWTESPLTPRGLRQSRRLALRLERDLPPGSYWLASSDLSRAVQTAEAVGRALDIPVQRANDLRSMNNGQAANLRRSDARAIANSPSEPRLDWRPYPHSESRREVGERIGAFLDDFSRQLANRPERGGILVTHCGVIDLIVKWWLGLDYTKSDTFFRTVPASLTVLVTSRWGERVMERLNDTAHLVGMGGRARIRLD